MIGNFLFVSSEETIIDGHVKSNYSLHMYYVLSIAMHFSGLWPVLNLQEFRVVSSLIAEAEWITAQIWPAKS